MAEFHVKFDTPALDVLIREEVQRALDPAFIRSRVEVVLSEKINDAISREVASQMRSRNWDGLITQWVAGGALKDIFSNEARVSFQQHVTKWVEARENILRDMALTTIRTHVQNALSLGKWLNLNLGDRDTSKNPAE